MPALREAECVPWIRKGERVRLSELRRAGGVDADGPERVEIND